MSSNIMPEQQAILAHLTNLSQVKNTTYFSGFVAALRERKKIHKKKSGQWTSNAQTTAVVTMEVG